MRIVFLVNDAASIEPRQTTTLLLGDAAWRGHETWLAGIEDLSVHTKGSIIARARPVPERVEDYTRLPEMVRALVPTDVEIGRGDVLFIRTNPARDQTRRWAHEAAMAFASLAKSQGALVLSDPDGLARASSKLYMNRFPIHLRPRTLVSRHPDDLRDFVNSEEGPCVLKPLQGTHGTDVFKVQGDTPNLRQIIAVLVRSGWVMAQEYVAQASEGDTRLILLQGQPLIVDGHAAAVRRIPTGGDFRSNVHAGGRVAMAKYTPKLQDIAEAVGPRLAIDGIFLAGLDVIGGRIVEINTFSPGGLTDAGMFAGGVQFGEAVIEAIENHSGLS